MDAEELLAGLKPFQRATVEHAFRRLWTDEDPVHRFLVADEVGLGKTLIAKGVAARAIAHLRETTDRTVTIVYICSNSQIAGQNLDRLRELTGGEAQRNADRLTMLPQTMGSAAPGGVDLIAFTPGTSLRLGDATGRVGERVLLHWMLSHSIDRLSDAAPIVDYFRDAVGFRRFADRLEWDGSRPALDAGLVDEFTRTLRTDAGPFGGTLLSDLFDELDLWLGSEEVTHEMWWRRRRMIGALRMVMAQTAVTRLAPDLVILDEFQRFKDLFPGARSTGDEHYTDAQQLAQKIIMHRSAKSLVLSATPYKMFTLPMSSTPRTTTRTSRHHRFPPAERRPRAEHLAQVREGMLQGTDEGTRRARRQRPGPGGVQRVMSAPNGSAPPQWPTDAARDGDASNCGPATSRCGLQLTRSAARTAWTCSSSGAQPFPVNLMDPSAYVAQRRTLDLAHEGDETRGLLHLHRRGLLSWDDVHRFREIDPGNPKLRAMIDAAWSAACGSRLAPPPCRTPPRGPSRPRARGLTKRLVFSAWSVVPGDLRPVQLRNGPTVSAFAPGRRAVRRCTTGRASPLLRFAVADGKLMNLPHLALLHLSVALAELGDPLAIARETVTAPAGA